MLLPPLYIATSTTLTITAAIDTASLQLLLTSSTTTYNINVFNLKMTLM